MDGIGHCAEMWIAFFFKQPLVHNALKLCASIAKDPNLIFIHKLPWASKSCSPIAEFLHVNMHW